MPITAHGSTMPTGPLVSVAILINSIAQMGIPFNPSSHHRYNWSMAKTMKQVSTISTRDAIAARCTSNPESSNREARNATFGKKEKTRDCHNDCCQCRRKARSELCYLSGRKGQRCDTPMKKRRLVGDISAIVYR